MVTKEIIKDSIEAKWRRENAVVMLVFAAIVFGLELSSIFFIGGDMKNINIGYILVAIVAGCFCLYSWIRYLVLLSHTSDYVIYDATLENPRGANVPMRNVCFTVSIQLKNKERRTRETKAIWSIHRSADYVAWDYMDAEVKVAYDEERDRLVVLGLAKDWRFVHERSHSNE